MSLPSNPAGGGGGRVGSAGEPSTGAARMYQTLAMDVRYLLSRKLMRCLLAVLLVGSLLAYLHVMTTASSASASSSSSSIFSWSRVSQRTAAAVVADDGGPLSAGQRYNVPAAPFEPGERYNNAWFLEMCLGNKMENLSLGTLGKMVGYWAEAETSNCRYLYKKFQCLYSVTEDTGNIGVVPAALKPKIASWLSNKQELVEQMASQNVVTTYNKWTGDGTLFNYIRSKRPVPEQKQSQRQYVDNITAEAAKSCDLCNYKKFTAADSFGRLEKPNSFSMSNVFKLDAWHSMIVFRNHHPLNWTRDQLVGVFNSSLEWFHKVHSIDARYRYPMIFWDLLPHAAASQIHPHIHTMFSRFKYYGAQQRWVRIINEYRQTQGGRNYLTDQLEVAQALGLAVRYNTAHAYASITPKRDNEIVVVAREANIDFFNMIYFIARAFIDDLEHLCFSLAVALPVVGNESRRDPGVPAFARIVSRGTVFEVRSDTSSMEYFAASNVNVDPFETIKTVKQSIARRAPR